MIEYLILELLKIFFILTTVKNVIILFNAIKNKISIKSTINNANIMWTSLYIVSFIVMFNLQK